MAPRNADSKNKLIVISERNSISEQEDYSQVSISKDISKEISNSKAELEASSKLSISKEVSKDANEIVCENDQSNLDPQGEPMSLKKSS